MATYTLPVVLRNELGSRAVNRLRRAGKIPTNLYGHKHGNINFVVNRTDFLSALKAKARMVNLEWDNNKESALIKEVQYDHLGDEVLHVDFSRIDADETVNLQVPIELFGSPIGLKSHGVLDHLLKEVNIECVVTSIPEKIRLNVSGVDVGQSITVKDVETPDGVKITNNLDAVVVSVHVIAEEKESTEEDMAEPEVITEKKSDEDGSK